MNNNFSCEGAKKRRGETSRHTRVGDLLEQHFETAFAALDGIARLRELILTLAMQGKLVEQDPNGPRFGTWNPEAEKDLLEAHRILLSGLIG